MTTAHRSAGGAESGFTLIEVLIASVLMLVGVFGMLAVFPQAYGNSRDAGRVSVLNHLAAEKLEALRALNYSNSDLDPGLHPTLQNDSSGAKYYPVPGFNEAYSLRWTVLDGPTDGGGNPEPDIKTVVVEATYLTRYTLLGIPITADRSLESVFQTLVTP